MITYLIPNSQKVFLEKTAPFFFLSEEESDIVDALQTSIRRRFISTMAE